MAEQNNLPKLPVYPPRWMICGFSRKEQAWCEMKNNGKQLSFDSLDEARAAFLKLGFVPFQEFAKIVRVEVTATEEEFEDGTK